MGVTGPEPRSVTACSDNDLRTGGRESGAESGATGASGGIQDPDLRELARLWPGLSPDVRQSILRLARGGQA